MKFNRLEFLTDSRRKSICNMETPIPHSSLQLNLEAPFFFRDGDKWVVETKKNFTLNTVSPLKLEKITVKGPPSSTHYVIIFKCVAHRIEGGKLNPQSEIVMLAQTVDEKSYSFKGGQFYRVSFTRLMKIASKIS